MFANFGQICSEIGQVQPIRPTLATRCWVMLTVSGASSRKSGPIPTKVARACVWPGPAPAKLGRVWPSLGRIRQKSDVDHCWCVVVRLLTVVGHFRDDFGHFRGWLRPSLGWLRPTRAGFGQIVAQSLRRKLDIEYYLIRVELVSNGCRLSVEPMGVA